MANPPAQKPPMAIPPKKPSIGLLGGIALAVGASALGFYVLDYHRHACACGQRWGHFGAFNMGDEESHTCSRCGQVQWWRNGAQHVLRGSQYAAPPLTPTFPTHPPIVQTYTPPPVPAYIAYVPVPAQVAPPPVQTPPMQMPHMQLPASRPVTYAPASPTTALAVQPKGWPW